MRLLNRGPIPLLIGAASLLAAALPVASALAQNAPLTLPPPGLMDPSAAPAEGTRTKPRAARKTTRKARTADDKALATDELAPTARTSRKRDPSLSETSAQAKPRRFVPEEFDSGDGDTSTSPRPFISPSGRAGVGMQF